MEYTEQEIEMLARFTHEMSGLVDPWESVRDERKVALLSHAREQLRSTDMFSFPIRAAARLMREAREQGAAEMRERAIAALRALPDGTWGDARGEMSPWPDAIDAVKALKVSS